MADMKITVTSGYSCEDHFYEGDTFLHSWEVLAELLLAPLCKDILVDVGMPVMHKNVSYNCRVIFLNKQILLIRPKKILCDNGNYRESRWFSAWKKNRQTEDFHLPMIISKITSQKLVPIGDAEVVTATIDLEDIRSFRNMKRSNAHLAASSPSYPRILVDFSLSSENDTTLLTTQPIEWSFLSAEEEIARGPACWLWDYLRRSGQGGFFLPLSGGIDSSSTALIVYSMCNLIMNSIRQGGDGNMR
ncbi:hypothetical protein NQ318_021728 [Aromia moschata]|uniref:Glutamine-dependent NAD(+) synthetase n=1 Tax=Aromia moschata TaxID=1265417 RepID=A0AAV8Y1G6_9CUCU|nr:hypothetical protein NQ318_021728 [Aromia moschata]